MTWEPDQYRRFADERAKPFHDLMSMIDVAVIDRTANRHVVDLGCGPGELTAQIAGDLDMNVTGIDNSASMLDAARTHAGPMVRFEHGDIGRWTAPGDVELIVASASLQWVSDHAAVLQRWRDALAPGGQLAVQVPANAESATHRVARELAAKEPYLSAFGTSGPPPDPVERNVLAPEDYARLLYALGFEHQQVRLQVYPHVLHHSRDTVEWVKGTTLTRFKAELPEQIYAAFVADYEQALLAEIGDQSPYFYPFKRILFVARRPR